MGLSLPFASKKLLTNQHATFDLTVKAPPWPQCGLSTQGRQLSHNGKTLALVVAASQVRFLVLPGGPLPPVPTSCRMLAGDAITDAALFHADLLGSFTLTPEDSYPPAVWLSSCHTAVLFYGFHCRFVAWWLVLSPSKWLTSS